MNAEQMRMIHDTIEAARDRLPMIQPGQAIAIIRLAATMKACIKAGNIILPVPEGSDEASEQAMLGADLKELEGFIIELQIASMPPWHELG